MPNFAFSLRVAWWAANKQDGYVEVYLLVPIVGNGNHGTLGAYLRAKEHPAEAWICPGLLAFQPPENEQKTSRMICRGLLGLSEVFLRSDSSWAAGSFDSEDNGRLSGESIHGRNPEELQLLSFFLVFSCRKAPSGSLDRSMFVCSPVTDACEKGKQDGHVGIICFLCLPILCRAR